MTDCGVYCSSSLCGGTRLAEHRERTRGTLSQSVPTSGSPSGSLLNTGPIIVQLKWVTVKHRPHDWAVKVGNLSTGPIIVQLKWVTVKHRPHDSAVQVGSC